MSVFSQSYADDCIKNGKNACKYAQVLADNMAKNLPMKIDQSTTIQFVTRIDNEVILHGFVNYDKATLLNHLKANNRTYDSFKRDVDEAINSTTNICQPDNAELNKFIKLGVQMTYSYRFPDNELITEVSQKACPR